MLIRVLALAALFGAATYADDIAIPLDGGRLVIRDAQFIRLNSDGLDIPELSFLMTNDTSSPWFTIRLKFDIGGICNFEVHHWSFTADVAIGYLPERPVI